MNQSRLFGYALVTLGDSLDFGPMYYIFPYNDGNAVLILNVVL